MKILVTGGAGFIGSNFVRRAIELKHEILNIDKLSYATGGENLSDMQAKPGYQFQQVDLRDSSSLNTVFFNYEPDAVVHLAAESHVDRSIDSPKDFIFSNIVGTYNLLEASRKYLAQRRSSEFRFLHVSTDEVFGSLPLSSSDKFHENSRYDPSSPYSASKASSDHLVNAWSETYGLPVVITNCSNNYGPYQFPEKLIPVTILNAISGNPIPVYGDGLNVRDWLYVNDHVDALLTVLEKGKTGRSYNIGGNNEWSNIELVEKICGMLDVIVPRADGPYSNLISFVADRPGHDRRYAINSSRISKELGWEPTTSMDSCLEYTVRWYLENESWWKSLQDQSNVDSRIGLECVV